MLASDQMLAEFEVEIGGASPVLSVPWADEHGLLAFFDLRENPALVDEIPESRDAALRTALAQLNSTASPFLTAKCDLWTTQELAAEEEIFSAAWKHASYIDLLWRDSNQRGRFSQCESAMREWTTALRLSDIQAASAAVILRRCNVWHRAGYYWTLYLSGFGETGSAAREIWAEALQELINLLLAPSSSPSSSSQPDELAPL